VRKPFYDQAPIQVSTDGRLRREVVQEIVEKLEAWYVTRAEAREEPEERRETRDESNELYW
jgi:hypothetical protein